MSAKQAGQSKVGGGAAKTWSSATVFESNIEFPLLNQFTPSDKLPDYLNVLGMLRNLLEGKDQGSGVTVDLAVREVIKSGRG